MKEAFDKLWSKLDGWLEAIVLNLPNLLLAILVFVVSMFVARGLRKLVQRLLRKTDMKPSVRRLVSTLITILVVLVGLLLALGILNLHTALRTMLTGAGIAGLVVGLALQGMLANSFAGVILALRHPVHVGDFVETNGFSGYIKEINLRNTKLTDNDNNVILIPNRLVIENPLKNFSETSQSRVIFDCGVTYDAPLRKVAEVTQQAVASEFDGIEPSEVEVLYSEFGDSSINFRVRFWIDATDNVTMLKARSMAIVALKEAFDAEGITIPFPIRTLEFNTPLEMHANGSGVEVKADETS